jgi:hypothetical protein
VLGVLDNNATFHAMRPEKTLSF